MKRIWIAGNAGSGKTTLASSLEKALGIPAHGRDRITWDNNDVMRSEEEQIDMTKSITATDRWIFEGARFTASQTDGRLDRCDTIINLDMNRFLCLGRVIIRAIRKSFARHLPFYEKQPANFTLIKYVLREYPEKRPQREALFSLARNKNIKVITLTTRQQVALFLKSLPLNATNE